MSKFHVMLNRKAEIFLKPKMRLPRLETGFSMLEAVVVVGVLLALAVGGFFAYGPITENAKLAKVKSVASEIFTAVTVAQIDGDASTSPDDVVDTFNSSNDEIMVEFLTPSSDIAAMSSTGKAPTDGEAFCIQATNIKTPKLKAKSGICSDASDATQSEENTDTTPPALPAVSTARLKFGVATNGGPLSSEVDNVARLVDEFPGYVMIYKDFTQALDLTELDAIYNKDAQPIVTWEPFKAGDGIIQPNYELDDITNGNHDAQIDSWINQIKTTSYDQPILIRFAHEMNGNWYPWAQSVNNNGDWDYVNAWKHVHDRFTAAGVQDKVDWVWAPNIPFEGETSYNLLYPGDNYVDIVGVDGFNFGNTDQWSDWKAPWDVLSYGIERVRNPAWSATPHGKPIIITETASVPSEGEGMSQAQWVRDLVYYLNESQNSDVIGFVWFDHNKFDELNVGQESATDWRLSTSSETATAMKEALAARR